MCSIEVQLKICKMTLLKFIERERKEKINNLICEYYNFTHNKKNQLYLILPPDNIVRHKKPPKLWKKGKLVVGV
jgi:hypothetical protein